MTQMNTRIEERAGTIRRALIGAGKLTNLLSDPAFKRIFGSEQNKDILIMFLNHMLEHHLKEGMHPVTDIQLLNTEQLPKTDAEKKMIYDILCTDNTGAQFIVEVQRYKHDNLLERLDVYGSTAILRQSYPGWKYDLKPTFLIFIGNFTLDRIPHFRSDHAFTCKQDGKQYFKGYQIILLQLGRLQKKFAELENIDEIWAYLLKNLSTMSKMPDELTQYGKGFEKLFHACELEKMTPQERAAYEAGLEDLVIHELTIQCARKEAIAEGLAEGRQAGLNEGRQEGLAEGVSQGERNKQ